MTKRGWAGVVAVGLLVAGFVFSETISEVLERYGLAPRDLFENEVWTRLFGPSSEEDLTEERTGAVAVQSLNVTREGRRRFDALLRAKGFSVDHDRFPREPCWTGKFENRGVGIAFVDLHTTSPAPQSPDVLCMTDNTWLLQMGDDGSTMSKPLVDDAWEVDGDGSCMAWRQQGCTVVVYRLDGAVYRAVLSDVTDTRVNILRTQTDGMFDILVGGNLWRWQRSSRTYLNTVRTSQ